MLWGNRHVNDVSIIQNGTKRQSNSGTNNSGSQVTRACPGKTSRIERKGGGCAVPRHGLIASKGSSSGTRNRLLHPVVPQLVHGSGEDHRQRCPGCSGDQGGSASKGAGCRARGVLIADEFADLLAYIPQAIRVL